MTLGTRVLVCSTLAAAALAAQAAQAHHSNAMFDMSQSVVIDGTVTRYEWANPHVYIFVAQETDAGETVEWAVEAHAPGLLRRMGWSRDTLAPGDRVSVTGSPMRNADSKGLFLLSMSRAEESIFDGATFGAGFTSAGAGEPTPAEGFDGAWSTLLAHDVVIQLLSPGRGMTLTEAGAAAVEAYDEATMNPAADCVAMPSPAFMFIPDVKTITSGDGVITIDGEYDGARRIILMNVASHDGAEPSVQGHSIGRFDGETLVIDTTAFTPLRTGNGMGLPSSPDKHLIERLTLDADRTGLTYSFELTDPPYLAAPATGTVRWGYSPGVEPAAADACSLENARRYIQE